MKKFLLVVVLLACAAATFAQAPKTGLSHMQCRGRLETIAVDATTEHVPHVPDERLIDDEIDLRNCIDEYRAAWSRDDLLRGFDAFTRLDDEWEMRRTKESETEKKETDQAIQSQVAPILRHEVDDYNTLVERYNALIQDYNVLWRSFVVVRGLANQYSPPPAMLSCTTRTVGEYAYTDCY